MTSPASRHRMLSSSCSTWPAPRATARLSSKPPCSASSVLLSSTRSWPTCATSALRAIPAADLQPGAILLFQPADLAVFGDVLRHWLELAPAGPVKAALTSVLGDQA